ncbi:MAG: protein translocase subunit SecDF [Bacilli bacterium]
MVRKGRIALFFVIVLAFGTLVGVFSNSVLKRQNLGLDLAGGFEILYQVEPMKNGDVIDDEVMKSTVKSLEKRINVLGVAEPYIGIEKGNRIRVQLAGVKDQQKAREILSTEANLTFRDVNDNVLMDGSDLVEGGASQTFDQYNSPSVGLKLKSAEKFKKVTTDILNMAPNNLMVIWLDFEEGVDSYKAEAMKQKPKFLSAATVSQVFNQSEVSIVGGSFSVESAKELADLLNAGSLPVKLTEIYSNSVGASFGQTALEETVFASIIGVLAIIAYMIVVYRYAGIVAAVSIVGYLFVTLLVFGWMNATLTLPGIAALVLGVGIAVDTNIITYERIRDELKLGKTMMSAFRAGNRRSLSTVLDANITTLLAACVLYTFGTSSVKGFATMLIVSILVSFLTNLVGTRILLELLVSSRWLNNRPSWFGVKKKDILEVGHKRNFPPTIFDRFDFVKIGDRLLKISVVITIAGVVILSVFKLNLGIDFSSGTVIEVESKQALTEQKVIDEFKRFDVTPKDVIFKGESDEIASARFTESFDKDKVQEMKGYFKQQYGSEPNISTVTPMVGKELAKNALIGILLASIGIILYVTIRFHWTYAVSAVVALLHDAFFIIVFFSLFRLEVDVTFIAAVLTIVGYSINDSIVTFDRVRENLALQKRVKTYEDLKEIVNESIRQTLVRSFNTVLTVLIAALALMVFGSEAIRNFSIALFVGLVVGTYSSVFIASQLWLIIQSRLLKKGKTPLEEKKLSSDEPQV